LLTTLLSLVVVGVVVVEAVVVERVVIEHQPERQVAVHLLRPHYLLQLVRHTPLPWVLVGLEELVMAPEPLEQILFCHLLLPQAVVLALEIY
jgi:hypothetical protein